MPRSVEQGGIDQSFIDSATVPEKAALGQLLNHPVLKQVFTDYEVKALIEPQKASALDVGFISKGRDASLVGIPLFGLDSCVGIVFGDYPQQLYAKEHLLRSNPALEPLFRSGGDIALMTKSDIADWLAFSDQLHSLNLLATHGHKSLNFSGLNRATEANHLHNLGSMQQLMHSWRHHFEQQRISPVYQFRNYSNLLPDSRLDFPFTIEDQQTVVFAPLAHVRSARVDNNFLVETIESEPVMVPGCMVMQPYESKREAYARAVNAEQYYQSRYLQTHQIPAKVRVPVISPGQLNLWNKLGLIENSRAFLPDTDLTTEDLVRYLFLQEDSIHLGELSRLGFSLPGRFESMIPARTSENGNSIFARADLILFKRNAYNQRRMVTLEQPVLGIDLHALKKGIRKTKPLAHIGGMIIVPEHFTADQIKDHASPIQKIFEHHGGDPTAHLLFVNRWLFEQWQANGSIFVQPEEATIHYGNNGHSLKSRVEYGLGVGTKAQIAYARFQPHAMVGGTIDLIAEIGPDKSKNLHFLNMGAFFGHASPSSQTSLGGGPGTALGLQTHLENGELPMIPDAWEPEYLLKSAVNNPAIVFDDPDNPVSRFIRSEIARNFSAQELIPILGEEKTAIILELARKYDQEWDGQWSASHWLVQHPHADHHQNAAYSNRDVHIIARSEAAAIIYALSNQARGWSDKIDTVSEIAHPKQTIGGRRRYVTQPRNISQIHWDHQKVVLSPNLTYQAVLINHSIPGSAGQSIESAQGHFINPGDIRPGSLTDNFLTKFEGQADILVLETTNAANASLATARTSETQVKTHLTQAISQAGDQLVVITAPKNHPERLHGIMEAAANNGRQVAISDKHANIINQLIMAKSHAPLNVQGFEHYMPHIGREVGLWLRPRESERPYIKALRAIAKDNQLGIVDQERLSHENNQWVIVIDPWEQLQYNFGSVVLHRGLSYIWSSYFVHGQASKNTLGGNISWLNYQQQRYYKKKFPYYADFQMHGRHVTIQPTHPGMSFHASGHGDFRFMTELAATLANKQQATIILVHGEDPIQYAKNMREYWKLMEQEGQAAAKSLNDSIGPKYPSRLNIISSLSSYNRHHPTTDNILGLSGFVFPFKDNHHESK